MKSCNSFKKMLSLYIDGILDNDKRRRIEAHIANCPACKAVYDDMQNIKLSMHSMPKIEASDNFDAVMRARLRQQIRHERHRTIGRQMPRFFETLKAPAYAVAAVTLIFFGAMLQRFYGASQYPAANNSVSATIVEQMKVDGNVADPGYLVVSQHDTVNNRIIIMNYVDLDQVATMQSSIRDRRTSNFSHDSLPDLRKAPTRQNPVPVRTFQSNENRPQIQYAKEYIF